DVQSSAAGLARLARSVVRGRRIRSRDVHRDDIVRGRRGAGGGVRTGVARRTRRSVEGTAVLLNPRAGRSAKSFGGSATHSALRGRSGMSSRRAVMAAAPPLSYLRWLTGGHAVMNQNQALWEKGDFTRIAATMRESGDALVESLGP